VPEIAEFAKPGEPDRSLRSRRKWIGAWVRYVVGLALGGAALWAVSGQRGELVGATRELSRLNPAWVLVATASEVASFVAFSRMQGRLLRAGGVRIPPGRLLGLTAAASAIASSLPAGPAVASVYAYRQYRRAGADESIAGWALLATLLCSALGLALVTAAGVLLGEQESAALDLVGVTVAVLVAVLLAVAVFSQRRVVLAVVVVLIKVVKRISGYPRGSADEHAANVSAHLAQVHLTWRDFGPALGWSLGNWGFDCGCLAFAYVAVGAGIPWRGLLLAYGAGQLASNLPITPGGLGVVEGSLTVALVAYGGVQISTVAAVILYRIISFWGFLPVGWFVWGVLAARDRRADRKLQPGGPITGHPPPAPAHVAADTAPGETQ
jgi:uncharacterized protein (TIRG00374 family)